MSERERLLSAAQQDYNALQHHDHREYQKQPDPCQSQLFQDLYRQYSTSIYLENKGSVARDHLANERTFLAWLRTSLSTISVGVAITQLFRLDNTTHHDRDLKMAGRPIGLAFILMGMLFLVFAFVRYFHAQIAMMGGYFPASRVTLYSYWPTPLTYPTHPLSPATTLT